MIINILHIADLHINKKNKDNVELMKKALFSDLSKIEKDKKIKSDVVFFTDDIIDKGEDYEDEFDLAKK